MNLSGILNTLEPDIAWDFNRVIVSSRSVAYLLPGLSLTYRVLP